MAPFYVWIAIALICAALEMGHPGLFYFLSFACGAVVAGAISLFCPESGMFQLLIFLAGTILSLILLRRIVTQNIETQHTNTDALIGKRAMVIEVITIQAPGRVRISGELWLARTARGPALVPGQEVRVVAVRGAHVVVEQISD